MGSAVWGAAVRQCLPVVSRGKLRWDGGYLLDESGVRRGFASKDGAWRADTAHNVGSWTNVGRAASFEAACEAMAIHLRAAGFEVPERPEGS